MQPQGERKSTAWEGPGGIWFDVASSQNLEAPELKLLYAYWLAKRADRLAPSRADIHPKDIPALLPSIHLYDVLDGGRAFGVRLIGTHIVAAIGTDPTGLILTPAERELMYERTFAALTAALTHKQPVRMTAEKSAAPQFNYLSAENLVLPLSDDGATVNKLLACTIFKQPRSLL